MKQAYTFFEQAHKKNRLAHLYLMYGEKGSGKMRLAQDVAYLILKQNDAFDTVIKAQIDGHKSPNVMVIEPDGQSIKKSRSSYYNKNFQKRRLSKVRAFISSHTSIK
jgi:DNA polymerase III subunit delta'